MRPSECIACTGFPCRDIDKKCYQIPDIDVNPEPIKMIMISEAAPKDPNDHYYASGDPLFQRTTVQAFNDAGVDVKTISDLLDKGVYFSTAVNYHVFKVFRDPVALSESVAPVHFSGNSGYQGVGEYQELYNDLEGSLFYSGNRAWLILFNKLEQAYTLSTDSLLAGVKGLDGASLASCRQFGPSEQLNLSGALGSETAYSSKIISPDSGKYLLNPYTILS